MASPLTDDDLLEQFAGGDVTAFGEFYERHLAAMVGFFLRRTGDRELTADLTAEVFAAALLAAERYRRGSRPALAWLYGIAAHKLVDSRRRGRVESEARRKLTLEPTGLEDDDLQRVDEMAVSESIEPQLHAAIAAMRPRERDAVLARVVQEREFSEIAQALACSEMVVRQRVSRGLKSLRSELEDDRERFL